MGFDIPDNWNSMQTIRLGLGYPTAPEFTMRFLDWWKDLEQPQIKALRTVKPNLLKSINLPELPSLNPIGE